MGSSNPRPTRVLWSGFSNTIPEILTDKNALKNACAKHNVEIIIWSQGHKRPGTLHYFFPLRKSQQPAQKYRPWNDRYLARYPKYDQTNEIVSYVVDHFNLLLDHLQPDVFVSWNRFDPTFGLPFEIAMDRGISCFDMERALLPSFLSLGLNFREDPFQFEPDLVPKGREILERFPTGHIYKKVLAKKSLSRSGSRKLLVLGSWDAVSDRESFVYDNSPHMAEKLAEDLPDWQIYYKPHPLAEQNLKPAQNLKTETGDPVSLIESADLVITAGTKLELDVVQAGKPLLLAGCGFLYGSGVASVGESHDEIVSLIQSANEWFDPSLARDYLASYIATKSSRDWFSLTEDPEYCLDLQTLIGRFSNASLTKDPIKSLEIALADYFSEFFTRYHRRGLQDFNGNELLTEVKVRAKRKLGLN